MELMEWSGERVVIKKNKIKAPSTKSPRSLSAIWGSGTGSVLLAVVDGSVKVLLTRRFGEALRGYRHYHMRLCIVVVVVVVVARGNNERLDSSFLFGVCARSLGLITAAVVFDESTGIVGRGNGTSEESCIIVRRTKEDRLLDLGTFERCDFVGCCVSVLLGVCCWRSCIVESPKSLSLCKPIVMMVVVLVVGSITGMTIYHARRKR